MSALATGAQHIYLDVEDAVIVDGIVDYPRVVRAVARKYGFTPRELEARYSRLRRRFEKALRTLHEIRRTEAMF